MDLRSELVAPAVPTARLEEISREIERISELARRGERAGAEDAVKAFNDKTGHRYALLDFVDYGGWRSLEDFAREAARPAWPKVPDITRDELVELVRRILTADPEADYYTRLLEVNVPHPRVIDMIFHPPAELLNASAEDIVDAALRYRAIVV
ncbi:hypothetical protein ACFWMG_37845 [Streptomyces sp. NPDC127074]|uniref:hypothetical protein n=1 Tax=Streptomyces sp. NPDC127074 TaxID=3347130 RepID=UPI003656063B